MLALLDGVEAEAWSAMAAWVTVLVAVVAGIVAVRQLGEARETRREQARLRREQAQPYVAVNLEPSGASPRLVDLVIRNYGSTAALDVRLTMTPPPRRSEDDAEPAPHLLPEVLPTLVPGQEWRAFWDNLQSRHTANLPDRHEVTVRFGDSSGDTHELRYVLDWRQETARGYIVVHSLHDMAKAAQGIAKDLHAWGQDSGGLRVWARDGDERQARRDLGLKAMKRRQRLQQRREGKAPPGIRARVADWWYLASDRLSSR